VLGAASRTESEKVCASGAEGTEHRCGVGAHLRPAGQLGREVLGRQWQ